MSSKRRSASLPRGFRFAAAACGLKKNLLDLALLSSDTPAAASAVFTTNLVKAAPVIVCRRHLRRSGGRVRAIIVNSGNANCATGGSGMAASEATASAVAREMGWPEEQVLVCSTGVIGVPLEVERLLAAVPGLVRTLRAAPAAFHQFTRAILTTDTRPKWAGATFRIGGRRVRLLGCAKGAGMIHPQMATMLAFIVADVAIAPALLESALRRAAERTFNSITIDGDTSTNDTLIALANGASGAPPITEEAKPYRQFSKALEEVCHQLALAIVADGEGAKRVIEIEVRGAPSVRAAEQVARTIAGSPLVKTAFAGADPNWGRILAAAGRAGVRFDPARVDVRLAGLLVCHGGREHPFSERAAHRKLLAGYVPVVVDLKRGRGASRIWTCDFTADYVNINARYRT